MFFKKAGLFESGQQVFDGGQLFGGFPHNNILRMSDVVK